MSNIIEEQLGLNFVLKETYSSSSRLVPTTIIKFSSVMFLRESMPLESSVFSMLSKGKEQYEILFHTVTYFRNFQIQRISVLYFCLSVSQFGFFQKMIIFKGHLKQLSTL